MEIKLFAVALLVICCSSGLVYAQQSEPDFTPTPNISTNPKAYPKDKDNKKKRIRYIIKPNTKNTLAGNKCFEDRTKKMGYMYLAMPKGQAPYTTEWDRQINNLGTKLYILFRNGPFWKIKERKIYKKCKYGWGDYYG